MADRNTPEILNEDSGRDNDLRRLDQDLEIMERHAGEMDRVEDDIQESMKKWDREFKDTRFHSVPKPRKHLR